MKGVRSARSFCLPLLLAFSAFPAAATSFDCTKASTEQEKAICADPKLSKLDEDLAAAYKKTLEALSPAGAAEVRDDQRRWVAWLRQVCPNRAGQPRPITVCLLNQYAEQLSMLNDEPTRVDGITFFPRLRVITTPDKEKPPPYAADPGFGIGQFSWPEIDRPTSQQVSWNAAVRQEAAELSGGTADFPSSVPDEDVDVFYTLKAANGVLISVDLENSTYDHGAAHPNEVWNSFDWWIKLGRPLAAGDIFRLDSGWQTFLARRGYEKLASGEHAADLYDEKQVRQTIADAVPRVSGWTIDARGFEIQFSEYAVAPRAAGPISVAFDWSELTPYLAAGFHPATLPQPLKPR